jgi:hypothetical protein
MVEAVTATTHSPIQLTSLSAPAWLATLEFTKGKNGYTFYIL